MLLGISVKKIQLNIVITGLQSFSFVISLKFNKNKIVFIILCFKLKKFRFKRLNI